MYLTLASFRHELLQAALCSLAEIVCEPWIDFKFYSDLLAIYSQKEKANSYFYRYFLCFQSISSLFPFVTKFILKRKKRRRQEEEEEEEEQSRGRRMLPAFLHHPSSCFAASRPLQSLRGNRPLKDLSTPNYQTERLLLSPCLYAAYATVDIQLTLLNSPPCINFSSQSFVALLFPRVPLTSFKNIFYYLLIFFHLPNGGTSINSIFEIFFFLSLSLSAKSLLNLALTA